MMDNEINKFYIPELEKQLKVILDNLNFANDEKNKAPLDIVRETYEIFKKTDLNLKIGLENARKLNVFYNQ
jgi:hypothetical protein